MPTASSGGGGGCGGSGAKPTPRPTPWHDGLEVTGTGTSYVGQPTWLLHSGGVCFEVDGAGGLNSAAVSGCIMVDRHGIGGTLTFGNELGGGLGGEAGVSGVVSNGSVIDQRGEFDTVTANGAFVYGGSVAVGTYEKVTTVSVGPSVGYEAEGGVGESRTFVGYHQW
jgi:hypothetical protein